MGALHSREYKLLEIVWYVNSLALFPHTLEPYLFPHTSLVPRPCPAFSLLAIPKRSQPGNEATPIRYNLTKRMWSFLIPCYTLCESSCLVPLNDTTSERCCGLSCHCILGWSCVSPQLVTMPLVHFLVLRNKRRDEEQDEQLDGEDSNEQEACSSSEHITEETDNISVDTGKYAYDNIMMRLIPRLYVGVPSWPESVAG